MPPLPVLPGLRVVRAMEKAGFEVVRIRGSHHVLRHPDGRGTCPCASEPGGASRYTARDPA